MWNAAYCILKMRLKIYDQVKILSWQQSPVCWSHTVCTQNRNLKGYQHSSKIINKLILLYLSYYFHFVSLKSIYTSTPTSICRAIHSSTEYQGHSACYIRSSQQTITEWVDSAYAGCSICSIQVYLADYLNSHHGIY